MADSFRITDEMRAQIGVPTPPWTYEVTTTGIRAYARGVGYDDPVYYDEEAAREAGYPALPAPPGYLGTPVYLPGQSDPTFSVPLGTGPRPRFGLTEVLDGTTETSYQRQLLAGDVLTATDTVTGLDVKTNATYGDMLFVTSETALRAADDELVATQRSTVIFY